MENSRNAIFFTNQNFFELFQNFYITDNSRIFTFWTIQNFSHYELFQNFYIIDHLRTCTFWAIQEFSHSRSLQNFYSQPILKFSTSGSLKKFQIPDMPRILTLWKIPEFFCWIIPEFLYFGLFPNFYFLSHKKVNLDY